VLFSGVAVAALFRLRWTHPDEPRPFKAFGYPVAPGIFAVASLVIVVNAIWRTPGPAGAGLLVILAGVPVYYLFLRQRVR
jgi:APA family basic amino acid/polyamine antiporter